jgi:ABC-type transport system substrate-binding protein
VRRVADAALLGQCADPRNAPDACLFGIVYGIYDAGPILQLLAASRSPANLAFLRSPAIDAALERGQRADGAARAAAWAAVNEQAVAEAGLVPLAWPTRPIPHSPDVLPRGVSDVDYAYTDLR